MKFFMPLVSVLGGACVVVFSLMFRTVQKELRDVKASTDNAHERCMKLEVRYARLEIVKADRAGRKSKKKLEGLENV